MKSSPTLPGKMHLWSTFILKKMQKFIEWSWHNNHNGQKHVCIAKRFVCMPQTYTYVFLLSPLYTWRKMILRKKRAVPPNHTKFTHVGLGCQTLVRLTSSWVLQFYLGTAFKSSPEFLSWVPPRSFHKSWCPGHLWHQSRKKLWVGTQAFTSFWSSPVSPHSSTLAWKIPWTEEPSRLQSMGSHRVRHDWSDLAAAAAVWVPCVTKVKNNTHVCISLTQNFITLNFVLYIKLRGSHMVSYFYTWKNIFVENLCLTILKALKCS